MRLLRWINADTFGLTDDLVDDAVIPPYAILSHTWGNDKDEVTLIDVQQNSGRTKPGYAKIQFCGERARRDGLDHFWVDTCCINKENQLELSTAIASMFRWYQKAEKCYVYLSDVSSQTCNDGQSNGGNVGQSPQSQQVWMPSFQSSRWFKRGWTLQELLAPNEVEFFSREKDFLGDKKMLVQEIHSVTSIPVTALQGIPLAQFSVAERMRWQETRQTKKKEDKAYCLLGIFQVFIPFIYGEEDYAFHRLDNEINNRSGGKVCSFNHDLTPVEKVDSLGLCLSSAPLLDPSYFIGRTAEIEALSGILQPDNPLLPKEQRRAVLGGMGGVGKTQMALAYIRQHQPAYDSIFWLNATSQSDLYNSLRGAIRALYSAERLAGLEDKQVLNHFHAWLSQHSNTRWLLVFDNYDSPEQYKIDSFCPNIGWGGIIITTRLPDLVTGRQVRIQPLRDIHDSIEILRVRSERNGVNDDAGAHRLAERLQGLPLALVTAGAYLRRSTMTFQQYLDTYEHRWIINPRRPLRLQEYENRTLHTTWDLSYSRLVQDDSDAASMLTLLAYFDHQDIDYDLLRAGLSERSLTWLQRCLQGRVDFENVMGILVEYCFIDIKHTTCSSQSYSLHSCVHDWTLGALNATVCPALYWFAFDCVSCCIDRADWDLLGHVKYARVSRHGVRLTHHRFDVCAELASAMDSVNHFDAAEWIATLLKNQIQFSAAESLYKRAILGCERTLGMSHISTLSVVNNLGILYAHQEKFKQAEDLCVRAIVGYDTRLGPSHISTLHAVQNLGNIYLDQGMLTKAEQLYSQALFSCETTLGPDHISTLQIVNSLGNLYQIQGKLADSEEMFKRALAGFEIALGLSHVNTISTVNSLGVLYASQDKFEQAEDMFKRALIEREKAQGPNHTHTLCTVHNLGSLYRYQNKLVEAEEMFTRALTGYVTALGSHHTSTLTTLRNLGCLYHTQGKLKVAEQMYHKALSGIETTLGPDHNYTLDTISDLGLLYYDQGKHKEAEQMYRRALNGLERALGPNHRSTLDTVDQLGLLYAGQDKLEAAEEMYQRALEGFQKTLGEEHADTCAVRTRLAELHNRRGLNSSVDCT